MIRRGSLWLVVFALMTAQALGLMHRVVHGPQAAAGQAAMGQAWSLQCASDPADGAVSAGASHRHGAGWVADLFSSHSDDSTCRLFDPLNHDAGPSVPAVVLPVILTSFFLDFFQGEFLVRWAALYDARGPPAPR